MPDNIVLIGFMGVGKGQVARSLADMTSLYAIDCDDLIESATNMRIKKIFSERGEKHFRQWEKRTARWLEEKVSGSVISAGGGFVNVPNLNSIGTIIYLHQEFDEILAKIKGHPNATKKIKKRPLLKDMDQAGKLFKKRVPLYRRAADVIVEIDGKSIDKVAREICSLCNLEVLTKRG